MNKERSDFMHNLYIKDLLKQCSGKLIIGKEDIILENWKELIESI